MSIFIGSSPLKSAYIGTTAIKSIWVGAVKAWPTAVTTYALGGVYVQYSASNKLYASGSNYAVLRGTLRTYEDGQLIEEEDVRLNIPSAGSNHYTLSSNTLKTNVTVWGTNVYDGPSSSSYFSGTFTAPDGTVLTPTFGSTEALVSLETNSRWIETDPYDSGVSWAMNTLTSSYGVLGGSETVKGTYTYDHHDTLYRYTSNKTSGGAVSRRTSINVNATSVTCSGATVTGALVTYPANKHTLTAAAYTVSAQYQTFIDARSQRVTVAADAYDPQTVTQNMNYHISAPVITTDSYAASGGYAIYQLQGGSSACNHTQRVITKWMSDGTEAFHTDTTIDDRNSAEWSLSDGTNFYFSTTGTTLRTVRHNSMGNNGGSTADLTHSIYVTVVNGADPNRISATSETKSILNHAVAGTPTVTVGLTCSDSSITAAAKTIYFYPTLDITTRYTYTSGSTLDVLSHAGTITLSGALSKSSSHGATESYYTGVNESESSRTISVTAAYGGKSKTVSCTQAANSKVWATSLIMPSFSTVVAAASGGYANHPSGTASHNWRWATSSASAVDGTKTGITISWAPTRFSVNSLENNVTTQMTDIGNFEYSATDEGASSSGTLAVKQEINRLISVGTWSYDIILSTSHSTTVTGEGDTITFTGTSAHNRNNVYTAGTYPDPDSGPTRSSMSCNIIGASWDHNTVQGNYSATVTIPANNTTAARTVTITMQAMEQEAGITRTWSGSQAVADYSKYITHSTVASTGITTFKNTFSSRLYFTYNITDMYTGNTTGDVRVYIDSGRSWQVLPPSGYDRYTSRLSVVVTDVRETQ